MNTNNAEVATDSLLKMTVKQLKEELERLKLPKTGVKKVLIDQLREARVRAQLEIKKEEDKMVVTKV